MKSTLSQHLLRRILIALAVLFPALPGSAAIDRFADVVVSHQQVTKQLWMLQGAGGNVGLLVTDDGVLMVDNQFTSLAERIQAKIEELAGAHPRFVLNTHFHRDHTGGNPFFSRTGTIIAHENVRPRLIAADMEAQGLPTVSYADRLRLYLGSQTIDVLHAPNGHTDGDSYIFFREANAIHLGDQFFNGSFPYVDIKSGGTVAGLIANITNILTKVDETTRIIPGHGPLGSTNDLRAYLEMLQETHRLVKDAITAELSNEEIHSQGLGEQWAPWGQGYVNSERWIDILLLELRSTGP